MDNIVEFAFLTLSVIALLVVVAGAGFVIVANYKKARKRIDYVFNVNDEIISAISRYIRSEMQIFYFKERMRMDRLRQDPDPSINFGDLFKSASFDIDSYTELFDIIRPYDDLLSDNNLYSIEDFIRKDRLDDFEKIKPFLSSNINI